MPVLFGGPSAEKLAREDAAVFAALVLDGALRCDDAPFIILCGGLDDFLFPVDCIPDLHRTRETDLVDAVEGDEGSRQHDELAEPKSQGACRV